MNKKERIFLDAMKHADRRYFTELSARLRNPKAFTAAQKGRAFDMEKHEKKRKITKIAVGTLIAAAVLGGGTMAAMVAMRGSHGGTHYEYSEIDSILHGQSSEKSSETRENTLGLSLTDQEWNDMQSDNQGRYVETWFEVTENGVYHSYQASILDPDGLAGKSDITGFAAKQLPSRTIWFRDPDTGEEVPLCARPNCLHDGNEYCEATSTAYYRGEPVWYDGVLYAGATTTCKEGEDPHNIRNVLLSYAPFGTGITELATFGKEQGEIIDTIVHRGYVWCLYKLWNSYENLEITDELGNPDSNIGAGYGIFGYEIATGKTTELLRVLPDPAKNSTKNIEPAPDFLLASGDWIGFNSHGKWDSAYKQGFYGIDLLTGECKQLAPATYGKIEGMADGGNILVCVDYSDTPSTQHVSIYNIEQDTLTPTDIPRGALAVNSKYIFACKNTTDGEFAAFSLHIYDLQGKEIAAADGPETLDADTVSMQGDYVYVNAMPYQNYKILTDGKYPPDLVVYRCKVQNILDGTATADSWEPVVTLQHNEVYTGE